jgi:propionate CoA-transferase
MAKIISAAEAAELVRDNDTIAMSGFGATGSPENLIIATGKRFQETGHPRNLKLIKGVAIGDYAGKGVSQLSKMEGLIGTIITAHVGLEPDTIEAIKNNKMMAYTMPLGTVMQFLRTMVGKKPGLLTTTGLKTFADPRYGGGKGNALTREKGEDIVELVNIQGKEALFYKYFPINICFVRGTYADTDGNISLHGEAILAHHFEMAAAVRNAGGKVIVQVSQVVEVGTLHPKDIAIPGNMVDYIVIADPEYTAQTLEFTRPRPELVGDYRIPISSDTAPMPLNERKIIGRRAAMEIRKGEILNLGIGMAEAVGAVALEEGFINDVTISIETGIFGGVPLIGVSFGAVANPRVLMSADDILEWYDGGGLDMTCLGAAEIDSKGNVNASNFNGRCVGPGGFVDISQNTKKACFLGTFKAGGLQIHVADGKLEILQEGKITKFKKNVDEITFSAEYAIETGQNVLYITERAVFKAEKDGMTLIEIAPGINLERDILAHMDFKPQISPELKLMDERIFREEKMGLVPPVKL